MNEKVTRLRIKGFESAPLLCTPVLTYKVETDKGRKVVIKTSGNWKLEKLVETIVENLK